MYKTNMKKYSRNDAVPDETFKRAKLEYCALAFARCAAAVSTADILRNPAIKKKSQY